MKKKLRWVLGGLFLSTMVWAGTIQENLGFPDMDIVASQTENDSQNSVWRTAETGAIGGQSFKLDAETTLRAVTFQKSGDKTFTGSPSEIMLWIGEYTNGVMAATNLLENFDVSGQTLSNNYYYSLNFDSDVVLDAGTYAYQLWFTQTNASHTLTMKVGSSTSYTNGVWFWKNNTADFPISSFTDSSAAGKDYTFGLHSAPVSTLEAAFLVEPDLLKMTHPILSDTTLGNISVQYLTTSGSNVQISSISYSDESNPGAFTNLTALPLELSSPYPASESVEFQFDNTVAGLLGGQSATSTATIVWNEIGGTNGTAEVVLIADVLAFEADGVITNTGSVFPTANVLVSQSNIATSVEGTTGQISIPMTAGSLPWDVGQTFTLESGASLSGYTLRLFSSPGLSATDTHILKVWVGEWSGSTPGETKHIEYVDMTGYSFAANTYHRIDFSEGIVLEAGEYAIQFEWVAGGGTVRFNNNYGLENYVGGGALRITDNSGGLPFSATPNQNYDYVFAVHGRALGGFDAWLSGYDVGASTNKTDNPDGDVYNNLYEYACGGDPSDPDDIGYGSLGTATLTVGDTNWFEYVYARRIAATNELVYSLEMSDGLVFTNWAAGDYVEVPATGPVSGDDDFESVTNRIDTTGKDVEFIRLRVNEL